MLLDSLGASVLEVMLADKGVITTEKKLLGKEEIFNVISSFK